MITFAFPFVVLAALACRAGFRPPAHPLQLYSTCDFVVDRVIADRAGLRPPAQVRPRRGRR